MRKCFKPYYNWNTFNTGDIIDDGKMLIEVLNLIITGIPSILKELKTWALNLLLEVLNLIITGIPSIL